jgi:hypothetical protein
MSAAGREGLTSSFGVEEEGLALALALALADAEALALLLVEPVREGCNSEGSMLPRNDFQWLETMSQRQTGVVVPAEVGG